MGKVIAGFGLSLDGYIADANDGVGRLFEWLGGGDTPLVTRDRTFMTSQASAQEFGERMASTGAVVTGRRDFDVSRAWRGTPPMEVPFFIVTHDPPTAWLGPESPFAFITTGVEEAVAEAKQAAGDRNVLVSGSQIAQQCINAGLLDEIHLDLVPVLLGRGVRLFDRLTIDPLRLEILQVVAAAGVTHLRYGVAG